MDLESTISLMVMFMKACGEKIKDMVRESITILMEKSIEVTIN